MKLIDLYKKWMVVGEICDRRNAGGTGGLCNAVPKKYLCQIRLFEPDCCKAYWASQTPNDDLISDKAVFGLNDLRQTIVLLICAMNNEL